MSSTIPTPGAERALRIGVLGAGQLGRMLALAGVPLGYEFVFVDPGPDSPAAALGKHVVCEYADPVGHAALAECDVVTYEFESVPVEAAEAIAARVPVYPPPMALRVAQDRLQEKSCFRELGIATAPFVAVDSESDLAHGIQVVGLPAVLKTRRLGYDGKGQFILKHPDDVRAAFGAVGGAPSILEGFVRFQREVSLIAARAIDGRTAFYPLGENQHERGILRKTLAPAPAWSAELQHTAEAYATLILERLNYVGVLAVELFQVGDALLVNEIAPRVHNSGHYTIEGSRTSQFENHLRAILGLPLGQTAATAPTCMLNLVGALPSAADVLAVEDAHLHLYGKAARPGRKVGHITVRGSDAAELRNRVAQLEALEGLFKVD